MSAISVRLPDEVSARLEKLSERTGRSKTFYIREALIDHIEDLEDLYVAEKRLAELRAGRSRTYTLDEGRDGLAWSIEIAAKAEKELAKLDWQVARRIRASCEQE